MTCKNLTSVTARYFRGTILALRALFGVSWVFVGIDALYMPLGACWTLSMEFGFKDFAMA